MKKKMYKRGIIGVAQGLDAGLIEDIDYACSWCPREVSFIRDFFEKERLLGLIPSRAPFFVQRLSPHPPSIWFSVAFVFFGFPPYIIRLCAYYSFFILPHHLFENTVCLTNKKKGHCMFAGSRRQTGSPQERGVRSGEGAPH